MEEAWERAVETALGNQPNPSKASPPRTLTLDGAVKCFHGRLPQPELLERYQSLQHLSIANVGVSSLEKFPRLRNLERLVLSDNRIAGGLEFLVEAGLDSLRDLDLSNNRIQFLDDLAPLAQLRLVSLDLYECPVTRIKDYRSKVFVMIRTLKYLDKMDADENERPETDDEDEEEEVDEDDDPGSGEVDGGDRPVWAMNDFGINAIRDGVVDDDEEESDGVEEELEAGEDRSIHHQLSNGFRVAVAGPASVDIEEDEEEEDVDDEEEEEDLGEEIDELDGEEEDEDVIEVHDFTDSDEEEDGVEEEEEEDDDEEEEEEEEEDDDGELGSIGRMTSTEGEIDEDEQGDDDENGEIGEEDDKQVMEDYQEYEEGDREDEDAEEEDLGTEYLLQPISQPVNEAAGSDTEDEDEVDYDEEGQHENDDMQQFSISHSGKRKRDEEDGLDDDSVEVLRASKHH